eukprot:7943579-Alexandrium_andersonii.AAC.1
MRDQRFGDPCSQLLDTAGRDCSHLRSVQGSREHLSPNGMSLQGHREGHPPHSLKDTLDRVHPLGERACMQAGREGDVRTKVSGIRADLEGHTYGAVGGLAIHVSQLT